MSSDRIILTNGSDRDYITRYDNILNARQIIELNESSTLEFQLEHQDPKWRYFEKPGTIAECDGRIYCIIGDGPITRQRDASGTHLPVVMKETWYKLAKKHITAYNIDPDESPEFDHIDRHMVALLGNSDDPLYVNGDLVKNPYAVGSAQYMFYCVLYGTGWSLDERYAAYWPDGVFDLETDKKTVLENLQLLQTFYGGMILWDSKEMRVALVDEEKYQPYDGFEIRYKKNLISIERKENHDIITQLYPYGNSHLNIAAVNSGREYIEDFSYTDEVLEGIVTHNDIYEQASLLQWGRRQSKIMARPRVSYEVDILRYQEEFGPLCAVPEIAHLCRVIDPGIAGEPAFQRVRRVERSVFFNYDCSVTVGDASGAFEGAFKDVQEGSQAALVAISSAGSVSAENLSGNISYNQIQVTNGVALVSLFNSDSATINGDYVRDGTIEDTTIKNSALEGEIQISDQIGFFGNSPIPQQSVKGVSESSLSNVEETVKSILGALSSYGLINISD